MSYKPALLFTVTLALWPYVAGTASCIQCHNEAHTPPPGVEIIWSTVLSPECSSLNPNGVTKLTMNCTTLGGVADDYACYAYHMPQGQRTVVVRGCFKKAEMTVENQVPAAVKAQLLQTNGPVCYTHDRGGDAVPTCLCNTDNCNGWELPVKNAAGVFIASTTVATTTTTTTALAGGGNSGANANPSTGTNLIGGSAMAVSRSTRLLTPALSINLSLLSVGLGVLAV